MVKRLSLAFQRWKKYSVLHKVFDLVVALFSVAGFAIIGAWGCYQLGFTKNKGAVDENYRYLMSVSEMQAVQDSTLSQQQVQEQWLSQYARLAAFGKFYPVNAQLIIEAAQKSDNPMLVDRMIAAATIYIDSNDAYTTYMQEMSSLLRKQRQQQHPQLIPWMNSVEWEALKDAIASDKEMINEAGRLTGVEPRLIAACLIGEQIRLFNSKREMFKKYLGPVKVLSVQSQFSYGVNGIKEHTAKDVEAHLTDTASEYYMGKAYEHLLDFQTADHSTERYNRLVDYRNHLYSYLYTGCILHQTMLQWQRAGYDISDRPDILCTLFNVGFSQSVPKANPVCGGSHIEVADRSYTFGAIGFDFYYSGELVDIFPYQTEHFTNRSQDFTTTEIEEIQSHVSSCTRPVRVTPTE